MNPKNLRISVFRAITPIPSIPVRFNTLLWVLLVSLSLISCVGKDAVHSSQILIDTGWKNYQLGDFDLAVENFQEANRLSNDLDIKAEALFGEASCWNYRRQNRNTDKARELYAEILRLTPLHPLIPWIELAKVRIQHFGKIEPKLDYASLADSYADVYKRYPNHLAGQEAFVNQYNVLLYDVSDDKQIARTAIPILQDFLTNHPETPFLHSVSSQLASCYAALNKDQERVFWMLRALEKRELDTTNPNADNSTNYWNIAHTAEFEVGDFKLAREYYLRLITAYPRDQRIFEAKTALRRMDEVEILVRAGRDPSTRKGGR